MTDKLLDDLPEDLARDELRRLIQEGVESGRGVPVDEAFKQLREHAAHLDQS